MSGKRILGIDYGTVHTGFAVSDPGGMLANGIETFTADGFKPLIAHIKELVAKYEIALIVLGHPINMNGTLGEKSDTVKQLAKRITEDTQIEVVLFDERCSTMAAHRFLNETDTRGKKRRSVVDTLSAQIILQNYLDMMR